MARFDQSVTINRPIEEVFAFVSDLDNQARWRSGLDLAELTSDGPFGVGATYREVERILGRKMERTMEVTEFEPNVKCSFKSTSGPVVFSATVSFEAQDDGIRVSMTADAELGGVFRVAEPMVVRMGRRQMESDLANLKELLEGQG